MGSLSVLSAQSPATLPAQSAVQLAVQSSTGGGRRPSEIASRAWWRALVVWFPVTMVAGGVRHSSPGGAGEALALGLNTALSTVTFWIPGVLALGLLVGAVSALTSRALAPWVGGPWRRLVLVTAGTVVGATAGSVVHLAGLHAVGAGALVVWPQVVSAWLLTGAWTLASASRDGVRGSSTPRGGASCGGAWPDPRGPRSATPTPIPALPTTPDMTVVPDLATVTVETGPRGRAARVLAGSTNVPSTSGHSTSTPDESAPHEAAPAATPAWGSAPGVVVWPPTGARGWVLGAIATLGAAASIGQLVGIRGFNLDQDTQCPGFTDRFYPPQSWCSGPTAAGVAKQPAWEQVALVLLVVTAAIAAGIALVRVLGRSAAVRRRASGWLLVLAAVLGVSWSVHAATWTPMSAPLPIANGPYGAPEDDQQVTPELEAPAAAEAAAATAVDAAAAETAFAGAGATAPVTQAHAHDVLTTLAKIADAEIGASPQRPLPLAVTEGACTTADGSAGITVSLTGQFSVHDLATARDAGEFLDFTKENEAVAERIVAAWERPDLLGAPEPLRGEWYQGPGGSSGGAVELAHVGFTEGVGNIRVDSVCTGPNPS